MRSAKGFREAEWTASEDIKCVCVPKSSNSEIFLELRSCLLFHRMGVCSIFCFQSQKLGATTNFTLDISFCVPTFARFQEIIEVCKVVSKIEYCT